MDSARHIRSSSKLDQGAAMVEFALVLPILLILLFGIIDFGLYFYNDLQLTQAARDAVRYASVGETSEANAVLEAATGRTVSITSLTRSVTTVNGVVTVGLTGTYGALTPLPGLVGIGNQIGIDATAVMRKE